MTERFSASNAGKHMSCHASANLELAIPGWVEPEPRVGGAADQGTSVHKILEHAGSLPAKDLTHLADILAYVAELRSRRRFKVLTEVEMEASWLDVPTKTTADLVLYTQDEIHIVDYKWGRIPVQVVGNSQLLFYGVTYGHLAPKATDVTVHVLQPRADIMHSWTIPQPMLMQFMIDARATQAAILAGSTKFGPSDHCTFCPANPHSRAAKGRPLCPSMMQVLYPSFVDEDAMLNE